MEEKISLREFISRREAEIRELRSQLLAELRELKAAKTAIESGDETAPFKSDARREPTIKEMIISVLTERRGQGTAEQMISWILEDFGRSVLRSSLSPQMSRLKQDGKLRDVGGVWMLTQLHPTSGDSRGVLPDFNDMERRDDMNTEE